MMRKSLLVGFAALGVVGMATHASANAANCGAGDVITPVAPSSQIAANTTWQGTIDLQGPVFVTNGATLTINAGTIVRGRPRQAAPAAGVTAGIPGAIIVTRSGRINALGSPTNSIIMTTGAVDNDNNGVADDFDANTFKDPYPGFDPAALPALVPDATPSWFDDTCGTAPVAPLDRSANGVDNTFLWGGVVILGNAPTNLADDVPAGGLYGEGAIEGMPVPGYACSLICYGGVEAHDNSGILKYVSVRHAGDEFGDSNELNGVSLGGVGDGTTISFVEVYANFDDGFEWFGGTVNGDHLVSTLIGDDSFDVDQGYTGINQYLFTIQPWFDEVTGALYGSASADKLMELDGDDMDAGTAAAPDPRNVNKRINEPQTVVEATPWPLSAANFYNVTAIGSVPDGPQDFVPAGAMVPTINFGIVARHCFAGDVFNSIVVNTGAAGTPGFQIDPAVPANGEPCTTGHTVVDHVNAGLIALVCSTIDDSFPFGANETTAVANGDALEDFLRPGSGAVTANDNNQINPAHRLRSGQRRHDVQSAGRCVREAGGRLEVRPHQPAADGSLC